MASPSFRPRAHHAVGAAAAVVFVCLAHFFAKQTGDDAFIFYRYADSVRAGLGPVWNAGERVEGFSSPLWLALLVVARNFASYGAFARTTGDLLAAAGIATAALTATRLGASRLGAALVALCCVLFVGSLHYWAPSGLETSLCVAAFGFVAAAIAGRRPVEWAIATVVLGLVRPEGLMMVPWSIACMALAWGPRGLRPAHVAGAVVPVAAYLVFRLAYYGVVFPNTYYAKATGPLRGRIEDGVEYCLWLGLLYLPLFAVVAWRAWRTRATDEWRPALGVLALCGGSLGIVFLGGGDWMWGHRLSLPAALPVVAVTFAVLERAAIAPSRRYALATLAVLVAFNDDLPFPDRLGYERLFGFNAMSRAWDAKGEFLDWRFARPARTIGKALAWQTMDPGSRMEGTMTDASADLGRWLRDTYPPSTLVAVNHAGAVPYYSGLPALDMTGLSDAHIAREVKGGVHAKYDVEYVLSKHPRLFVLNTRTRPGTDGVWYHDGYWEGETALVHHPTFVAEYAPVERYWEWGAADGFRNFILVYERRGAP